MSAFISNRCLSVYYKEQTEEGNNNEGYHAFILRSLPTISEYVEGKAADQTFERCRAEHC
jgi:hypothetical protein